MSNQEMPKLKVCALHVSSCTWSCIPKDEDKILTFNQLALESHKDGGTILLSGPCKGRDVYRHFGKAPGTPHSYTKPYIFLKGEKFRWVRDPQANCAMKPNPRNYLVIKKILDAEKNANH